MSIYVIGDLHLSFKNPKPMDIFGDNWENHEEKIKQDWLSKVKNEDTVILAGDFSWAINMEDALDDFQFINNLPGKKILLKGNHDYWWTTVTSMKRKLEQNNILNIDFLYNNSFEIENKILCGTRGWSLLEEDSDEDKKIINREVGRLKYSIQDGIQKYGDEKEIIVFLHYPPITQAYLFKNEPSPFIEVLKESEIKKCYYGHLHGPSIKDAVNGNIEEIELKLVSADGVDLELQIV